MILNTGARTDTVQYFSKWLLKRFEEGFVYTRNPLFPNNVTRYELFPDKIDAVLFCSKNYAPILPRLSEITDRYRTYFYYTITAYGKDIEPRVPSIDESIETLIALSKMVGKERVAWRYDPILLTEGYTVETHLATFAYMAKELAPYIDRCIFSFVELYQKLKSNMPELILLTEEDKEKLAEGLGRIAKEEGIFLQTCGTNGDYSRYGIHASGCATLEILGKATTAASKSAGTRGYGRAVTASKAGTSAPTTPVPTAADTVMPTKARKKRWKTIAGTIPPPLLLGHLTESDRILQGDQKSFLAADLSQCSLL